MKFLFRSTKFDNYCFWGQICRRPWLASFFGFTGKGIWGKFSTYGGRTKSQHSTRSTSGCLVARGWWEFGLHNKTSFPTPGNWSLRFHHGGSGGFKAIWTKPPKVACPEEFVRRVKRFSRIGLAKLALEEWQPHVWLTVCGVPCTCA